MPNWSKQFQTMNNMTLPDLGKKGMTKHKIGWCSVCGWTHGVVKPYSVTEEGHCVIKPICQKCREKDRASQRMVVCAVCGLKPGATLFPATIEKLVFDDENTCNLIVPLCENCKTKPHSELREKLQVPNMCEQCVDRFKCYTSKHDKPADSQASYRDKRGFQHNMRTGRRW